MCIRDRLDGGGPRVHQRLVARRGPAGEGGATPAGRGSADPGCPGALHLRLLVGRVAPAGSRGAPALSPPWVAVLAAFALGGAAPSEAPAPPSSSALRRAAEAGGRAWVRVLGVRR